VLAHEWLTAELEWIWLITERELRALQEMRLRPAPDHTSMVELEAILAARRASRAKKNAPYSADELAHAIEALDKKLVALRGPALALLNQRLGLSGLESQCALLIAATSLDPPLSELFNVVRGPQPQRRGVDPALMAQLLRLKREDRLEMLSLFDVDKPLLALRLVQAAGQQDVFTSMGHRALQPTLNLLWVLSTQGEDVSPGIRKDATLIKGKPGIDDLLLDDDVKAWLEPKLQRWTVAAKEADASALPWLSLWGPHGVGKREVAARLATAAGRPLLVANPQLVERQNLLEFLRAARRDADWLGAVLFFGPMQVETVEEQPGQQANKGPMLDSKTLNRELEQSKSPIIVGVDSMQAPRLKSRHAIDEHSLRVPLQPNRLALWKRALGDAKLDKKTDLQQLSYGYKLTPGEVFDCAREAIAVSAPDPVTHEALQTAIERRMRNELGESALKLDVPTTWDDVILKDEQAGRVREFIGRKQYEDQVYRVWGLDKKISYGKGLIALFSGPPGTGKTLLAGLIANQLGLAMYQVDLSSVLSRWIGETEKALNRVFDQAERAHAVLLFDEADALFAKRTEVDDARDRYANVLVNFLLQRLERYSGVAILTTNKESYLDPALQRRLSLHLLLDEPEVPERAMLWKKHLPANVPGSNSVDVEALAKQFDLTGGYIKNVALRGTFLAAMEQVPLSTELLFRAAVMEMEDMGKVVFTDTSLFAAQTGEPSPVQRARRSQ
jgi:AAA+ superfamily predicted ATPase